MTTRHVPHWLAVPLLALVTVRVVGIVFAAISYTHGDYYASLPGAYVRTANPVLWDSPDLQGSLGYHRDTYFHGPTQYLVLYPMAWFDSYAEIARVLLVPYGLVIGVTIWLLRDTFARLAPGVAHTVPLVAATLLFFPLLQAYLQREFEIVALLGLALAMWLLVRDRRGWAAAILASVAWFKYIPLLFGLWVAGRGWVKAFVAFGLSSLVILATAHALFDLRLFFNNNVPSHAAQVLSVVSYEYRTDAAGALYGVGFCTGWFDSETTLTDIRHAMCSLGARRRWLPPNLSYLLVCTLTVGIYLMAYRRFERVGRVSEVREGWRRSLEVAMITTICACYFFSHYYYLSALVLPFAVLLARYLTLGYRLRLAAWAVAYVLVSAFLVPTGILTQMFKTDVWALFIRGAWFMWGELLLMGLLLREYWDLSRETNAA